MRFGLVVTGVVFLAVSLILAIVSTFSAPTWSVGSRLNGDRGLIVICQNGNQNCAIDTSKLSVVSLKWYMYSTYGCKFVFIFNYFHKYG